MWIISVYPGAWMGRIMTSTLSTIQIKSSQCRVGLFELSKRSWVFHSCFQAEERAFLARYQAASSIFPQYSVGYQWKQGESHTLLALEGSAIRKGKPWYQRLQQKFSSKPQALDLGPAQHQLPRSPPHPQMNLLGAQKNPVERVAFQNSIPHCQLICVVFKHSLLFKNHCQLMVITQQFVPGRW